MEPRQFIRTLGGAAVALHALVRPCCVTGGQKISSAKCQQRQTSKNLLVLDVNPGRVGECGKLEPLVDRMLFYRQLYLVLYEYRLAGRILTRAHLFVGGDLA